MPTSTRADRSAAPAGPGVAGLAARYSAVRAGSLRLVDGLSPEDCTVQSMPDASPAKWHLAHTTWFFETFVLERMVERYQPFDPAFRILFNSYYNSVGEQYPRPERGLITRPGLSRVLDYRTHVDRLLGDRLAAGGIDDPSAAIVELGLHHEQQHQELLLTDLKHALARNPLHPVYRESSVPPDAPPIDQGWHEYSEEVCEIGHAGDGFCFDNETPRHRVLVHAFELARRTVTNGEFVEFIQDGGYTRPELWLADGWTVVRQRGWNSPEYWIRSDGDWSHFTLAGLRLLLPAEPVCHVSFYEAEAFARWAGARLPTEAEWEVAARQAGNDGNFVDNARFHPVPAVGNEPAPAQLLGNVWEWTASPYVPYPGYRPVAGALGEYNGKFMCNQMVLRGGSCATSRSHIRTSYRNFFYPDARWQFTGIRLAREPR